MASQQGSPHGPGRQGKKMGGRAGRWVGGLRWRVLWGIRQLA